MYDSANQAEEVVGNLIFPHLEPFVTMITDSEERIKFEINSKIIEKLKNDSDYKVITIGGYSQGKFSDKKILFDSLQFILESSNTYKGIIPECCLNNTHRGDFSIFPNSFSVNIYESTEEKVYFILADDLRLEKILVHKDLNELYCKCIDKLYGLFMLLSDAFILNIDSRQFESNEKIKEKFFYFYKFLEKKKKNKKVINNVEARNFFIFMNYSQDFLQSQSEENERWKHFKVSENIADWIFPIEKIPKEFLENRDSIFLKDSNYYSQIKNSITKILKAIVFKQAESKFSTDRLILFTNILNLNDKDVFGELIQLEFHLGRINQKIKNKLKILNNFPTIINIYNYPFYQYEITHETIQVYIEEEIKREKNKDRIKELIKNMQNKEEMMALIKKIFDSKEKNHFNSTDLKKEKTHFEPDYDISKKYDKDERIEEKYNFIKDELDFNDKEINSIEKVHNKNGVVGKIITLENGDSYLVYRVEETGELKVTDAYGLSNNWLPAENVKKSKAVPVKVKVKDFLKQTEDESYSVNCSTMSKNKASENVYAEEKPSTTLTEEFSLGLAAAGISLIGSILANFMTGHYKNLTWRNILKRDLLISGSISVAVTGVAVKLPWIGLALIGSIYGVESYDTLTNEAIDTKTKSQIIAKTTSQVTISVSTAVGSTYLGTMLGYSLESAGSVIGGVGGLLLGALIGGFAGTFLSNKLNDVWKILNKNEIMNKIKENMRDDGELDNIEMLLKDLRIDYDFVVERIPEKFLDLKSSVGDRLWVNFILMNVISLIACCNNTFIDESKDLLDKSFAYLTLNKIQNNILYYVYLDSINIVLEKWIGLLK